MTDEEFRELRVAGQTGEKVVRHRGQGIGCTRLGRARGSRARGRWWRKLASWTTAALAVLGALSTTAAADLDVEALRVAPYADTPNGIVHEMLALARVGPGDYVIDLGSGDGRLVIAAVKDFGARAALGVDINEKLVAYARASAAEAGVADRATFLARDLFATDLSAATVVTLYLFPAAMARVRDKLQAELAPGTRVVSHDFPLPGWHTERIATFAAPEKELTVGRSNAVIYLYTVPKERAR